MNRQAMARPPGLPERFTGAGHNDTSAFSGESTFSSLILNPIITRILYEVRTAVICRGEEEIDQVVELA
jgi:hypothetical protein